ncbi:MAG TPA: MFS transporter [Sphingomonadaceae bacterium]|nr:MFS transporter [Sphingomonadaceae bacterium]
MTAANASRVIDARADADGTAGKAGSRGWYTVVLLSAVMMLAYIDRGVIALFVQPMKRDLGLTDTEVSVLLGFAFTFPYVVVGLPMSRIVDRGVRKYLVVGSLALWSLTTALCGLAQNFWSLFVGRAVVGSSESVVTPAAISLIADAIPPERLPRAYAIYNGGITAGSALALLIGGVLMGLLADIPSIELSGIGVLHSWHLVFMIVGIPGLLVAALIVVTVPEPLRRGGSQPKGYPLREVFGSIVGQRALHLNLLTGMVLLSVVNQALGAWMPAFYERTYGWGPAISGPLLGMVSLGGAVVGLVSGAWLAEWFGKRRDDANVRVLVLSQALALPLTLAGPLMPSPWLALAFGGVGGALGVMGGPAFVSALQIATPNEMRGQVNVLYATLVNVIGGSLGPTLTGLFTDHFVTSEADIRYALVAIKLLFGPAALFFLWRAMKPYGAIHRERVDESRRDAFS